MEQLTIKAPAKINLTLDIINKRPDGYHEVEMIMQTLELFDVITIKKEVNQSSSLLEATDNTVVTSNHSSLLCDKSNLVYKAADLLRNEFHFTEQLFIHIEKNIPIAAGMAGGSTDCASTLLGINQLLDLGLSIEDLQQRGVTLGADVPYCIVQGTALAKGIGEILTPLPNAPDCFCVVVTPTISVSTKWVYENFHLETIQEHPNTISMIQGIRENNNLAVISQLGNVLETVTIPAYPIIDSLKKTLIEQGADNALMSGSGPTVFGLFTSQQDAKHAYQHCKKIYPDFYTACTKFYQP